ncbi:MAG: phosphoserine transaminase, partial [Parvibaculales bacterium]
DGNWIDAKREGLTICDATSAIFAQKLPWDKLDVVTFSWQKVMGGEAAHGMIILSPRAIERLESYVPPRPLPKIFRMTKKGKLIEGIFEGATINTPSMIAVEDYLAALNWAETIGGEAALQERADANLQILKEWVANTAWVGFLCEEEENLSNTSVCFKIIDEEVLALPEEKQAEIAKKIVKLLEKEGIAYDIGAYRDAPHGLRLWAGGTIETHNLRTLTIWLDWAFASVTQK